MTYRWVRLIADPDVPVGLAVEERRRMVAVVWMGETRPRWHRREGLAEYRHPRRARSWSDYLEVT